MKKVKIVLASILILFLVTWSICKAEQIESLNLQNAKLPVEISQCVENLAMDYLNDLASWTRSSLTFLEVDEGFKTPMKASKLKKRKSNFDAILNFESDGRFVLFDDYAGRIREVSIIASLNNVGVIKKENEIKGLIFDKKLGLSLDIFRQYKPEEKSRCIVGENTSIAITGKELIEGCGLSYVELIE
ncbi:MAG: hypothetical protein ABIA04_01875 [Pseudomonadota bacterium]